MKAMIHYHPDKKSFADSTFTEKDFYLRDEITKVINAITADRGCGQWFDEEQWFEEESKEKEEESKEKKEESAKDNQKKTDK